ncbi:transposable element Tcb1 transposase [Trichonephila clavipes]|nr:transposable element Tcb1 transposase [Trichonephila clavipes]
MHPRRNRVQFQQLTEFERTRIIGFRDGEFSCHAIAARVQLHSDTSLEPATEKTGSGWRKGTSALDDRHLRNDWQKVVFSDESRFGLCNHDGHIRVRRNAGERCLPKSIIKLRSGRTPGCSSWDAISYHERSLLLQIEGSLNSNRDALKGEFAEIVFDGGDYGIVKDTNIIPLKLFSCPVLFKPLHEGVNISVKLFRCSRAFDDGLRHFEPESSDRDDT